MTGGEEREPLWATSLAELPPRGGEPYFPAPAPAAAPGPAVRPGPAAPAVALACLVVVTAALVIAAAVGRGTLRIENVPSAWGDVPMTCDTARMEDGPRAVELFRCEAIRGGALPPGLYRSPQSQWTSDLTRVDARASEILIDPDGGLVGIAVY